jgi:uncharacterized protein YdeI (YjbR/CyaY-like superfamily)
MINSMEIGATLYITNRDDWRLWLSENYATSKEIWLIFYKKQSRKLRISYDEAVEEALCFGWIDSTVKTFNEESTVQRFSPRRKNSELSEMNKERVRRLIESGRMTQPGLESIKKHLEPSSQGKLKMKVKEFILPEDILEELKKDPVVWSNFKGFPEYYKQIRIGFIDGARKRPQEFKKRMEYFIKMTAKNKKFGMIQ